MPETIKAEVGAWMMSTTSIDQSLPDLSELLGRPEWMERAACRGEDPAVFFPSLGADAAKARAICASCAVRQECLAYALADPESAVLVGRHLGAGAAETGPLGGVGTEPRVRSPSAPKRPGVRSPA